MVIVHKKRRIEEAEEAPADTTVIVHLRSHDSDQPLPPLSVPCGVTREQLELLLNELLQNEESLPYAFRVESTEILDNLWKDIIQPGKRTIEDAIEVVYQPLAVFRVRAVTRCTSSLSGK
jgi:ribosome assembly protein 4